MAPGEDCVPPEGTAAEESPTVEDGRATRRYPWADLLRRVFAVEVLECPDCGGRMRILAAILPPEATCAILECLGLPSRTPPAALSPHPHPPRRRSLNPPPPGPPPTVGTEVDGIALTGPKIAA